MRNLNQFDLLFQNKLDFRIMFFILYHISITYLFIYAYTNLFMLYVYAYMFMTNNL